MASEPAEQSKISAPNIGSLTHFNTVTTRDSQGYITFAEYFGGAEPVTVQFPPYPNISPITITVQGKSAFTVVFTVEPTFFTLTGSYAGTSITLRIEPRPGFYPLFNTTLIEGQGETTLTTNTLKDMMMQLFEVFSKAFPVGTVGDVSGVRSICSKARALMTPATVDAGLTQSNDYLSVALDLHLIPFGMQVTTATLYGIAAMALEASVQTSYPLTPALDFIWGKNAPLYLTFSNALGPLAAGPGGSSGGRVILQPRPTGQGTTINPGQIIKKNA